MAGFTRSRPSSKGQLESESASWTGTLHKGEPCSHDTQISDGVSVQNYAICSGDILSWFPNPSCSIRLSPGPAGRSSALTPVPGRCPR